MTTESCWFTPSLVNAMHWIITIYNMVQGIYLYVSLPLITIRVDDDMYLLVLIRSYAEDSRMTQSCHFRLEMLISQMDCIVMRMRHLVFMRKTSGTLLWLQTEFSTKGSDCE